MHALREMNASMDIPSTLPGIRDEDIPLMAKRADAEGNPLYPVPRLMDAHELEHMYHIVQQRAHEDIDAAKQPALAMRTARRSPLKLASRTARIARVAAHRAARRARRRIRIHR